MAKELSNAERSLLLSIARNSIEEFLRSGSNYTIDKNELTSNVIGPGACFVTLTRSGDLRGCIGSLEAYQPLYKDVQKRAIQAATQDYRFNSVTLDELKKLTIEISILTPPASLEYSDPADLINKLRPGIDGVTIEFRGARATFLPQVWEELTKPEEFLSHLCAKMGAKPNLWKQERINVETYQVIHFDETSF